MVYVVVMYVNGVCGCIMFCICVYGVCGCMYVLHVCIWCMWLYYVLLVWIWCMWLYVCFACVYMVHVVVCIFCMCVSEGAHMDIECMYSYVYACVYKQRPKVDVQCLPSLLSPLFLEAGPANWTQISSIGLSTLLACQETLMAMLGLQMDCHTCPAFIWVLWIWTLIPMFFIAKGLLTEPSPYP